MGASTDNYTLGKGVVNFNRKVGGIYTGEKDLGNCPEFSFNISLEKLDHYSSRGGLKAKDKEVVSQISPSISFTLDEISAANVALLTMADIKTIVQAKGSVSAETHKAYKGTKVVLDNRKIGLYALALTGAPTTPGTVGLVITGDTSSAAGTIASFDAASNVYLLSGVTGTFVDGEPLTVAGGTATEGGTTLGTAVFTAGKIVVKKAAVALTEGVDYQVSTSLKDDIIGRVEILEGSTITDGDDLIFTYDYDDYTYTKLMAINQTSTEGMMRFVSDNPIGTQMELEIWRVSLTPSGDTAMIGEEWSTLAFAGEILKDETKDPLVDSQYFNIIMA